MNHLRLLAAAVLCAAATGCFSPHTVATRHFILTSAPATEAATTGLHLGVGVVKMPDYLMSTSLAVRKSAGEVRYLETAMWAERLDNGFARVLAADLSVMIPTDQVRLGSWRPEDVALEVYVTVEQFDVDQDGKGTLVAWWRITAPGGAKVLKSGEARLTRAGKSPASDSQNIVTTLSELTAEFSGTLAQAVRDVTPSN
jgi:uncharacterized lipoprotein YmbA